MPPTILLTDKAWNCKILKQRRINVCLAWFGSVTLHWGDWDFTKKEWLTHLTVSDEVPSWAIALRQQRRERVNVFDWLNILTNKRATKMFDWANCKNNTIGWRCLIGWTVTANATDDRGVGGDWGMAWVHQVPVTSWSSGSCVTSSLLHYRSSGHPLSPLDWIRNAPAFQKYPYVQFFTLKSSLSWIAGMQKMLSWSSFSPSCDPMLSTSAP